jgi:hypothetical protein
MLAEKWLAETSIAAKNAGFTSACTAQFNFQLSKRNQT